MEKNRKDMLIAVIIVVFIHLIIIFAVYLSFKKNDENKTMAAPLSENIDHSSNSHQDENLDENSDALLTLTELTESSDEALETEKDAESENKAAQEDELAAKLEASASAANDELSNELQDNQDAAVADNANNSEKKSAIKASEPHKLRTDSDNNDKIYVKDNVVLLNRDLPQSSASSSVSGDAAQVKAEAERINEELSAAINEVKNRNQQQIEQREQEKAQK